MKHCWTNSCETIMRTRKSIVPRLTIPDNLKWSPFLVENGTINLCKVVLKQDLKGSHPVDMKMAPLFLSVWGE